MTGTTPAVGGERQIPAPDPVARDYLLLCLRMDQHIPGFVDGYFGPADLKAQVDMEQRRAPAMLRDDAAALRMLTEGTDVSDPARRRWLAAQAVAMEVQARALAGDPLPYADHVAACFDHRMQPRPDAEFAAAAAAIDSILPGAGPVADRLAAWDERFVIPIERLTTVVDWLLARLRDRARATFGLPEPEAIRVALVTNQLWGGYNWYDGALQSRVDINTDLPVRAPSLIHLLAHEAYPGHHLEHAWHEADLVGRGRLEMSVLSINTPECFLSEGLADLGHRFAVPPAEEADLLVETCRRAGLPIATDPAGAREAAARTTALAPHRSVLDAIAVNAALMRHADGASHDATLDYLQEVGLMAPDRALKRLDFIEHPLWRTYIFVYSEGEALLRRWLEALPPADRVARFGRLFHEQLTPSAIVQELTPGG